MIDDRLLIQKAMPAHVKLVTREPIVESAISTSQAMSFTYSKSVMFVSAPWLDTPMMLDGAVEVEGKFFIKLPKADAKTIKFLTGKGVGRSRVLTGTTIIETLVKLRNERYSDLCSNADKGQSGEAADDLGLDAPDPKRLKHMDSVLPKALVITCPAVEGVDSVDISVLAATGQSPLAIEIGPVAIDYLHNVIERQLDAKSRRSACTQ